MVSDKLGAIQIIDLGGARTFAWFTRCERLLLSENAFKTHTTADICASRSQQVCPDKIHAVENAFSQGRLVAST